MPDELAEAREKLITNMRSRLQLCRRLAVATHDLRASDALRGMAYAIETDLQRLEGAAGDVAPSQSSRSGKL